jgi:hypothetical protein
MGAASAEKVSLKEKQYISNLPQQTWAQEIDFNRRNRLPMILVFENKLLQP